jgi:hypothetical protein
MTTDDKDLKKILADLKEENTKAAHFLAELDASTNELDVKYVQVLLKDDVENLKTAKRITKEQQ